MHLVQIELNQNLSMSVSFNQNTSHQLTRYHSSCPGPRVNEAENKSLIFYKSSNYIVDHGSHLVDKIVKLHGRIFFGGLFRVAGQCIWR